MTITRTGSNQKYASNWDSVFGGKSKSSKGGTGGVAAGNKTQKEAKVKKGPTKKAKPAAKPPGKNKPSARKN
jgi:hypothetical protein